MQDYFTDFAWETVVWCADDPTRLIHLDGDRWFGVSAWFWPDVIAKIPKRAAERSRQRSRLPGPCHWDGVATRVPGVAVVEGVGDASDGVCCAIGDAGTKNAKQMKAAARNTIS